MADASDKSDAPPETPEKKVAAHSKWHDRVSWPIVTGLIGTMLLTMGAETIRQGAALIDGCDAAQKAKVSAAERALNRSDLVKADDLGEEVLLSAPNCRCAHLLMAKTHLRLKQVAEQAGDKVTARIERKLCLRETLAAREPVSPSPQVRGLEDACSAGV